MKKAELVTLLTNNDVSFDTNATLPTLVALATENGLLDTQEDDDNAEVVLRPNPYANIKNGHIIEVEGLDVSNVKFEGRRTYTTEKARAKYATVDSEGVTHDGSYLLYSYKKNGVIYPFVSPSAKFDKLLEKDKLASFKLVANVTGKTKPATDYDQARPEILFEAESIVSDKAMSKNIDLQFKKFVFSPATFVSNPELLSKSGLLQKIMNESVG